VTRFYKRCLCFPGTTITVERVTREIVRTIWFSSLPHAAHTFPTYLPFRLGLAAAATTSSSATEKDPECSTGGWGSSTRLGGSRGPCARPSGTHERNPSRGSPARQSPSGDWNLAPVPVRTMIARDRRYSTRWELEYGESFALDPACPLPCLKLVGSIDPHVWGWRAHTTVPSSSAGVRCHAEPIGRTIGVPARQYIYSMTAHREHTHNGPTVASTKTDRTQD
jgi:hypothetical protein